MEIQIEDVDLTTKKLTLVIPFADYQKKLNESYRNIGKDLKAPGFRKGKIPTSLIEKQYGPQVKREVLTELISDRVMAGIQEKSLNAVSQPHLLEVQAEEGTDITVTASVEVMPEFEVADYSGIDLTLKISAVTDEDVQQAIDIYRERNHKTSPVDDRTAQEKDLVKLDFVGNYQGESFEGSAANGYVVELGTGQLIEGMEAPILGMAIGEEKVITVKLPEAHPNKNIAGKDVEFNVTLRGIQTKELPEVTDEFAQKADPAKQFKDVADMKERLRVDLEKAERDHAMSEIKKELADKLVELNPIHIPDGLLDEQIRYMISNSKKKDGVAAPAPIGEDGEAAPISEDDRKVYSEPALKVLRSEFLLDSLSKKLDIKVAPEEVDAEIGNFARMLGGNKEKLKKEWEKSGMMVRLYSRMKRDRTLDAVMKSIALKEETVDTK
ncbi:MAG: trigger factor [Nitrospinae bacterium CG11_big_fil_rev_8_21_14_0_20_45_15]|nr:MAG: trigger factor [Nitrospinae bacterium CG11_big_fil_rev_8_21_14_0_20_45_15]